MVADALIGTRNGLSRRQRSLAMRGDDRSHGFSQATLPFANAP